MDIDTKLEGIKGLFYYYRNNRRVGHTTAMLNGAKSDKNIKVMIANWAQCHYIDLPKDQFIIYDDCNYIEKLHHMRNPLLIEHLAFDWIISDLVKIIQEKDKIIEDKDKQIEQIKKTKKKNILCLGQNKRKLKQNA